MNNLIQMFLKSQKFAKIRLLLAIITFGAITFFIFKTAPVQKDIFQVDSSGGEIIVNEGPLKGLTILVPETAYTSIVDFDITSKPFDYEGVPDLFEPISPLIHIDNQDSDAQQPLTVTIPIDIDTSTEFAMAFYFDETTHEFEAIPTLTLTNDQLQIYTSHFSNIIVSKVMHAELFDLVFMNPEKLDSGFTAGVDDFPFNNYGSELTKDGHCAGQSLAMMWYYTERKLKLGEESLHTRFDEDTPDFWLDDTNAYRFASILQDTFDFDSPQYDYYFDLLKSPDQERFFSAAYALYITRKPQLFAVYALDAHNQIAGGHALVINKISYDLNHYKIHIVDPNFNGDTNRYITYDENSGFGTYYSGKNADDITNNKGVYYTEIAHIGQSALTDYKNVQKQFDKVLNHTIGEEVFSSVQFEYLKKQADDTYQWVSLPKNLTYEAMTVDQIITNRQIGIRVIGKWQYYQTTIFKDHTPQFYSRSIDWKKLEFTVDLSLGVNQIGIYYEQLLRNPIENDYDSFYNGYYAFEITLVDDEPVVYDWDEVKRNLPGQYVELERSSGVMSSYPNMEINLSENISGETSILFFDHTQKAIIKSGRWYASNTSQGFEPGTPVLLADMFFVEDEFYVIDPAKRTITITFSDGEYIVYEQKKTPTYVYYIFHRFEMYQVSGNVYDYHYEEIINSTLSYQRQWKIDMMIPDGNSGQDEILIISNNPMYQRVIGESRSIYTSTRVVKGTSSYYVNLTHGDQFTLWIELYTFNDGEWVLNRTETIQITVDFSE